VNHAGRMGMVPILVLHALGLELISVHHVPVALDT
jgi:hypothetical protein